MIIAFIKNYDVNCNNRLTLQRTESIMVIDMSVICKLLGLEILRMKIFISLIGRKINYGRQCRIGRKPISSQWKNGCPIFSV